jgi:hypothetical protein
MAYGVGGLGGASVGGSDMLRQRITQALMGIQNPPPQSTLRPQGGLDPSAGMGAPMIPSPAAGSPAMATTPGAPGSPPIGAGGYAPIPPVPQSPSTGGAGIASTPGLLPGAMGQSMQPGGRGPQFAPPPLLGQGPQAQSPEMVQPPALGPTY